MRVWLTLFVVLLAALPLLAAESSSVSVVPLVNEITTAEQASYKLVIKNTAEQRQRFSIYSFQSSQGWSVDPSPFKDKIIELGAGKEHTTTIIVKPLEEFPSGIYDIQLTIESDLGEKTIKSLRLYLSPDKPLDYLPSIKVTVDMDEKVNPQEPVSIKLFLENRNPLDLSGLTVKLQSEIPEFTKEVMIDLPPLEKRTVEFAVTPNPYQQPKEYSLFFIFERNGQLAKVIEQRVEVLTLIPPFAASVKENAVVLKSFREVHIINDGNTINTQDVAVPVSAWQALLLSSDGQVERRDGQYYVIWPLSLAPGEEAVRNFVVNYRIPWYVLIVALLLAIFYLLVRSPVQITKKAVTTKGEEEGSLSQIKVTLELRNVSKHPLHQVEVIDMVPPIANVEKSLELGTLKPKEVKHTHKGTKVIWSMAELDAQEHRLITYNIKAKLNILGMFSLPRVVVEYQKGKGRKRKAYSNIFRLGK